MVTISKSEIVSDIWENFYDRINSAITDPNASDRDKWIFACVDDQTECLTTQGWKSVYDLTENDSVYTYKGRFRKIQKINQYYVEDLEMIKIETTSLSMRLTPNHKVLGWQRSSTNKLYPKLKEAKDIKNNICIPQLIECKTEGNNSLSDELIQLLGWILTKGHFPKEGGILIYQSESANPEKVIMIQNILNELGYEYNDNKRKRIISWLKRKDKLSIEHTFCIYKKHRAYLESLIPAKRLTPEFILNLTKRQRELLIETMLLGDGSVKGNGFSYTQKNEYDIDMFSMLAILAGYRVHKSKDKNRYICYLTKKKYTCIREKNGSYIEKERYTGTIWCPTTKDGTFLARRKGRIFYTGNSFPAEDIENRSIDWPVIVINPITISWEKFSLTKNYAMCSINIELYTTSAAKADEYTDKILDGIETSKDDLRDLGIELIYLTDRFSDVVFRGKNTIHTNTLNFSFRYVFEKTRTY